MILVSSTLCMPTWTTWITPSKHNKQQQATLLAHFTVDLPWHGIINFDTSIFPCQDMSIRSWNDYLYPFLWYHITSCMITLIPHTEQESVYITSRQISMSLLKGNHHQCPRNDIYHPILCLSRRPHPTCRPWNTWLSADEVNGKQVSWH